MTLLDIGGGFPGNNYEKFSRFAGIIRTNIDEYFPETENVKIIAEPGRYFASAAISITANIIAATKVPASRITKKGKEIGQPKQTKKSKILVNPIN